jgi:WD40 repeat protein/serine/threonine protein kinase
MPDSIGATLDLPPDGTRGYDASADPRPIMEMSMRACGRFLPLRPHARGGLGEVFVARDGELGREVALKAIQERFADDEHNQARFVREAQITGNLEHPGIVPVYGLGRSPDGRPYYAMRFIEGESFDAAIARFHKAEGPGRDPGERSVALLKLLRRFTDVCQAVDYAHSRGVLHRDLKPANIMLGPHGETLVVDWGLAKHLDQAEGLPPPPEATGLYELATSSSETLPGSTVGTPAYMSPEQAAGRLDCLSPASDIYNLGATFYCLLTGRPPFENGSVGAILWRVERGEFRPPREVAVGPVPSPLEAICLKAMALRPEDRYSTAAALAEDILRWVADEPVSVHRESPYQRFSRWARRHRTLVRSVATGLVGLLVVLAVATVIVHHAYQSEQDARRRSEELSTHLDLEQGLNHCEQGAVARGMLRLAHALSIAPPNPDLRGVILANLAGWRRTLSPLREILPNRDSVRAVAFSRDGTLMLTAGTEARLWTRAGEPVGRPLQHGGPILTATFSPDGKTILTASTDATARFWNTSTGEPIGEPIRHPGPVVVASFAPDGRSFLTASGGSLRLWRTETRLPLPSPPEQGEEILSAAFAPDGKMVAIGDDDGSTHLWNLETLRRVGEPMVARSPILSIAFSPDGKLLAIGSEEGHIRYWDVATSRRLFYRSLHPSAVYALAFSPDGKTLLSGSEDNTARLWDVATGNPVGSPLEHRGSVNAVAFGPESRMLLTGSGDRLARLWEAPPGHPYKAELALTGRVLDMAMLPDGRAFATAGSDGRVRVWDTATLGPLGPPLVHPGAVNAVAFGRDERTLLTACADGSARLWDTMTGRPIGKTMEHRGPVTAVAFSPDGRKLATGGEDAMVHVWDAADGHSLCPPIPQPSGVVALTFCPNSRSLGVASGNTAHIYDLETCRPRNFTLAHQGPIYALAFRRDARVFATASEDNSARLWDAATGTPIGNVMEHHASVGALAFSPDGESLLTGCHDRTARLWDASTSEPIGPPLPHLGQVSAVAFGPGGSTLLTGGLDRVVRVWDVPRALDDDVSRIMLWVRSLTGLTLETRVNPSGLVEMLDDPSWHRAGRELARLGGPPLP